MNLEHCYMWGHRLDPGGHCGEERQVQNRLRYPLMQSNRLISLGWRKERAEPGGLKQTLISHSSEERKSKIMLPTDSVSGESSFPGLWIDTFLLFPHMAKRGGGRHTECAFWFKGTDPIVRTTPWPHLILVTSPKPHFQIPAHWVLGLQHMNLGRAHSFHNTAKSRLLEM